MESRSYGISCFGDVGIIGDISPLPVAGRGGYKKDKQKKSGNFWKQL
jgi:hypothetical protein